MIVTLKSETRKQGEYVLTRAHDDIAIDLDKMLSPIDLQGLFTSGGPVHVEVGSGTGTFLLHQAQAHPELNFLGIEWANKYYQYSVDRMCRWQMANVRVLRTDARDFIRCYLPEGSVEAFHVYFPDPWPKKRHQKRRFFSPGNIGHVLRCLSSKGQIRTATDHKDYYQVMREVLLEEPDIAAQLEEIDFFPTDAADPGEWVGSNFERKYIKQGRWIQTLAVRKRC